LLCLGGSAVVGSIFCLLIFFVYRNRKVKSCNIKIERYLKCIKEKKKTKKKFNYSNSDKIDRLLGEGPKL